jgi:hypothetical protein
MAWDSADSSAITRTVGLSEGIGAASFPAGLSQPESTDVVVEAARLPW